MYAAFSRFARDDSGGAAIEYGLIAGLIGAVMIAALTIVGTKLNNSFTNVGSNL